MELHPSESVRESVRLLVGPLPPDTVPAAVRRWLDRPAGGGLSLEAMRWLRERLTAEGQQEPLFDLLAGGTMELPSPVTQERNPELEARCQRLRAEQEERSYRKMVRNVDSNRFKEPSLEIGKQMREVNAQLVEVGQVVFSVGAAFLFGYMATAVAAGGASTATRILAGLAAALVVLVAEGYFLLRYLSYADDPPPARPAAKTAGPSASPGVTIGAGSGAGEVEVAAAHPPPIYVKKRQ
ncbi:transmembrane protein 199-like [Amphibalanus amphitrite]|uniref:transmembrane protein 199-like n=1 Tax=Amphibalanus amphitrite TaxID=1232801 RepID=UPI001C9290A5|nr:transmembrane protein 199-like [Amphibalanus amphitrite]XP_043198087.1 transmembrane protein 199-like [Amphibalanus amphitrite]XP_043198088.1 transmembrane protein 199-like [Amphibalanus amphitrite]XP_043198089.1 transmembrane protein 199-like [Amphibalanus amphitrite]XP_043198090.1 transmembrane protein 199-like [Amphibalanus amphitrite]